MNYKKKKEVMHKVDEYVYINNLAWDRERSIPTEQPQLVGKVSANFCG
jgi:hypothetical protein